MRDKLCSGDDHLSYNTLPGILVHTQNLELFHKLISTRQRFAYKENKELDEFIVFGMYHLDSCGNCSTITPVITGLPNVITKSQLYSYTESMTTTLCDVSVAPINKTCALCNKLWTIRNVNDVFVESTSEMIEYDELVECLHGEDCANPIVDFTIGRVKKLLDIRHPHAKVFLTDQYLQNDRFIDLTNTNTNVNATYSWPKNKHGWVGKEEGITDDYVIQHGDKISYQLRTYYHKRCHTIRLGIYMRQQFEDLFRKSGFDLHSITAIPNEYCKCERCTSWFIVIANDCKFKIGWRKRVINIQCETIDFMQLFPEENVTKSNHFIHAWGYDEAKRYLKKIRKEVAHAL